MASCPRASGSPDPLFASFWMGGYEGADHVNGSGVPQDLVAASGHDVRLDADYRAARRLGLRCVRESIGWRLAERADGSWDLARAVRMAQASERQGVQVLWTLMHYGIPADLSLFDDSLIPRFARFAGEVARVLRPLCAGPRIYTPINEISFLCWIASATHDVGPAGRRPGAEHDLRDHGYLFKQRLVRAALAGMAAIRAEDPEARFLHIEPVVHVAAPDDGPEHGELAERTSSYQWQALDMLAGRLDPHLGGHPQALDIVGLNHYHTSQWEVPSQQPLEWHLRDPRRMPLSEMLQEVWQRYGRPIVIAETGHVGVGRAAWLNEVGGEARRARSQGVPLEGVCLYPLLDRPDWNDGLQWHRSGLWHLKTPQTRSLNRPYARALLSWRDKPACAGETGAEPSSLIVLLPCAWEDWQAPRERLLAGLKRFGRVCLIEPPRRSAREAMLRVHSLSPAVDLFILHGQGAASWSEPPVAAQLALVREALADAGQQRSLCWLAGWHSDSHPAWWRELGSGGLVVQPAAGARASADVLQRARSTIPSTWPLDAGRRSLAHSYESAETARMLSDIPSPHTWLVAPSTPASNEQFLARLLPMALRMPDTQWLVDATAPRSGEALPLNIHWLGRVHESLHAALATSVHQVVPWTDQAGWTAPVPAGGEANADDVGDSIDELLRHLVALCAPGRPNDRHPLPITASDALSR